MKLYEQTEFTGPSNVRYWLIGEDWSVAELWDGAFVVSDRDPKEWLVKERLWQLLWDGGGYEPLGQD